MSGFLEIINSIAVFQLVFFTSFLFIKGNKIPSTFFLKFNLVFQLIGYNNCLYFIHNADFVKPFLPLSMPCMFLWAPTFYFYVRSRLYRSFVPSWRLMLHGIPAFILMIISLFILLAGGNFHEQIDGLRNISFHFAIIQQLVYYVYTLYIIYKYQNDIKFLTSTNEKQKLNWLFLITYGIALTSFTILVMFYILNILDQGCGFFVFWIFLNILFFKAIIHPDQFLGIDEKKLLPIKPDHEKNIGYFKRIEDMIDINQLFLDPDLSLHNVAQEVKLSERIVSQTIKQNVALNFTDYINLKRIDYAKEALRTTTKSEKNILEILYEAGFNSKSVFNTQFRKHTGQSPTLYRDSYRDQNVYQATPA